MIHLKTSDKNSDKRKAILDASLKLFCNNCFQDTSTASISQQAKVATGTLFLYFENKEELVNELYLECKNDYAVFVETGVWEHANFKLRLKHIWDKGLEWKLANPDKFTFMLQFTTSPYITKMTKEKALTRLTIINDVVKKAVDNKDVTTSSVELLSALITGYFNSASMYLLERHDDKHLAKWSEEGFNYIWKGIS